MARLGRQSQARISQRVVKGALLSRSSTRVRPCGALARPFQALSPAWGQSVGGVSERPTREGVGSDPRDRPSSRWWKAPGLRDDVTLRGVAPERGSRPVRRRSWRALPLRADAPATVGAPWTPRRGTSSACVNPITRTRREGQRLPLANLRGHVLHSVQGPVLVYRGSTPPVRTVGCHATGQSSRSGKPG